MCIAWPSPPPRRALFSGHRELTLPDGEQHRLRYVPPWSDAEVDALLSHPQSPAYVNDRTAHGRIRYVVGGVLRMLISAANLLALSATAEATLTAKQLAAMEATMRDRMRVNALQWLGRIAPKDRAAAASAAPLLLRDEATLGQLKGAYDAGLVALAGSDAVVETTRVRAVSTIAGSVLHAMLAGIDVDTPISSLPSGVERGIELERQLHRKLDQCNAGVPTLTLSGELSLALQIRVDGALKMDNISEAASHEDVSIMYVPSSPNFAFDAVIVPCATYSLDTPVLVLESSVTSPRDSKRMTKCQKWFGPGKTGVLAELVSMHSARGVVIGLCYHLDLDAVKELSEKCRAFVDAAKLLNVRVCVLDAKSLRLLRFVL